jgi:Tfp pilus assembly protein PilN
MTGVNLIPASIRAAQAARRHLKGWGLVVAAALAANALPLVADVVNAARAAELRRERDALSRDVVEVRREADAVTAEAVDSLARLERAKALRSKRAWSAMFTLIGSCMPDGAWLTSVATDPPVPGGAAPARRGPGQLPTAEGQDSDTVTIDAPRKLKITGCVRDHALLYTFMGNLKSAQVFTAVEPIRSGEQRVGEVIAVGFELTCEW